MRQWSRLMRVCLLILIAACGGPDLTQPNVRATGEVTPSGWQPGQVTLKPGPALVSRVWQVWKP